MAQNATLLPELSLAAAGDIRFVAGMDEVGRGALAGPVTIGVTVFDLAEAGLQVCRSSGVLADLDGVRDSKLLTRLARQRWAPVIRRHVAASSVHHGEAARIDQVGIAAVMRDAGLAALKTVEDCLGCPVDAVIIDGAQDWLTRGASERMHPMVKADVKALSVASASVIAKVERDLLMETLGAEHPGYGWESNRGYGSAPHRQALRQDGPTPHHRLSWNLGVDVTGTGDISDSRISPPQESLFD